MELHILRELILFCKNNSFTYFSELFKAEDIYSLLNIPAQPLVNVYNLLKSTEIVDLNNGWKELTLKSSSVGNQEKYINTNTCKFIKLGYTESGRKFKDYLVEIIASSIFGKSVLNIEILQQKLVLTNKGFGVISDLFTSQDTTYETFYQVARKHGKLNLPQLDLPRMDRLMCIYEDYIKFDATDYLLVMIFIDCLVLNEDRHLRNFGYLRSREGNELPPIFDFGLGLFEHSSRYDGLSLKEALGLIECKLFTHDNLTVLKTLHNTYLKSKIDFLYNNMRDVSNLVFPNKLSIEYYDYIRKELSLLCGH